MRRRWRALAGVLGLSVLATVCFAIVWVLIDRRAMATSFQHYDLEGWRWLLVVIPGAMATAVLWAAGKVGRWIYRLTRRGNRGPSSEVSAAASEGVPQGAEELS